MRKKEVKIISDILMTAICKPLYGLTIYIFLSGLKRS